MFISYPRSKEWGFLAFYLGPKLVFFIKIRLFFRNCVIFIAFRAILCYPIVCESACSLRVMILFQL